MLINFLKRFLSCRAKQSTSYLTMITGPLKCRRQWFHNKSEYKNFFKEHHNRYNDSGHGSSKTLIYLSQSFSGLCFLALCEMLIDSYEHWKTQLKRFFPGVEADALTIKDLAGRRKEFGFIADVAEVAAPAVVYIEIWDTKKYDYYTGKPTPISNGSGFIVEHDGLIMTNAHVVIDNALGNDIVVMVKLLDGRAFEGKVESVDRISDLATVRIKSTGLPVLQLGTSQNLTPGEFVIALGSPLALSNTVTCGIISAYRKAEELGLHRQKIVYIQTDASINQGNSGGPLMNLDGEVIGINSMKILPGISFAIPMDHARKFLRTSQDRRFQQRAVRKHFVGITMLTLTNALIVELRQRKCSLSNKVRGGVLIWKVLPESPAERGGLNPGDIVTHVNGKEVKNSSDIYDALLEKGKKLDMTVYRGLKQLRIVVEPEE